MDQFDTVVTFIVDTFFCTTVLINPWIHVHMALLIPAAYIQKQLAFFLYD